MTSPNEPIDSTTGLGDINAFDVFLFKTHGLQVGVGPQLTFPTAGDDLLGTGKYQAGAGGRPPDLAAFVRGG